MKHAAGLLALAFVNVGCIDTDAAVFVEATLEGPSATVQTSSLVTGVAGGFTLKLHLGPRASAASQVDLNAFKVLGAGGVADIVPALGVTTDKPFPVRVDVDSTVVVTASFVADDNQLETAAADKLCAPGGVVIAAALDDSLRGGAIDATSSVFSPSGCP